MEPLSASHYSLNTFSKHDVEAEPNYLKILGSTISMGAYEQKNLKNLLPQILAAITVAFFYSTVGISFSYSAILLPQLEEKPEIALTQNEASWIASIQSLSNLIGSLMVGFLMDRFGRLKTLKMAAVPGVLGCVLMATAQNVWALIFGRIFVGFGAALGSSPVVVYITEIARKDMRGSLISLAPAFTSIGMVLTILFGWLLNWRQVAWLTTIFYIVPCILCFFIPESPAWLVSKGHISQANKSLKWIHKYQPAPPQKNQTFAELQLALLLKEHELRMISDSTNSGSIASQLRDFLKPTGYKPLFIITGLFLFQQFSGIFVFFFYSIKFFQEVGSTYNPYLTSIFIGLLRLLLCLINSYTHRIFGRRPLLLTSCFSMSFFLVLAAVSTVLLKNGTITQTWVPVVLLLSFVVGAMIGIVSMPMAMAAELFPLKIRGLGHCLSICICNTFMFSSLQLYPPMLNLLGGMSGVLFFFSGAITAGAIFVYVFLPETQGKKLSEVEDYFWKNMVYVTKKEERGNNKVVKEKQQEQLLK